MKKTVLFLAAGFLALAANAQSVQMAQHATARANQNFSTKAVAVEKTKAPQLKATMAQKMDESMQIAPITSAANGVYYKQPAGTMYRQWDITGRGYGADFVQYQAYGDVVFYDECKNPRNSSWLLGSNDIMDLGMEVEEDGRTLIWTAPSLAEGYAYPIFTLQNGRYSYTLAEEGRLYQQGYTTRMTALSEITPLGFLSDHNSAAGYYGWSGFNTKHYLFGAGSYIDDEGVEYTFVGCEEKLPAPMSPLYVESIDLPCYTFSVKDAIPAGKELTLELYIGEDQEATVTLTATADDFSYTLDETGEIDQIDSDYGILYVGNVHFSIKGIDAFGTETEEPFVLNDSSLVVLSMPEGVDVGFGAYQNYDPDALENARILLSDGTGIQFQNSFQFKVVFNGILDQIYNRGEVEATTGEMYPTYYVTISEDGTSSTNYIFSDLDGALFYTASEWYTEDGDENYSMYTPENFPTWITGLTVNQYGDVEEGNIADTYTIGFTAEPLPADVAGRGYFVYLQGRGVIADLPIFAFQGDIEVAWEDAQNSAASIKELHVKGNKAVKSYNLFGQPVSTDYKGFVVVDGQKQIRF